MLKSLRGALKNNRLILSVALLAMLGVHTTSAQDFVPLESPWGQFQQVADQGALNTPLTAGDRVVVSGAHFVKSSSVNPASGSQRERVRLFGINLGSTAAFPDPQKARELARTLRSLGFNAVRLHHLDTYPTSDPTIFRSTLTEGPYPTFHSGAIQRLKTLISALQQEGIYVNLNIFIGYKFRPQEDGIQPLDPSGATLPPLAAVRIFDPKMVELQQRYATELLRQLDLGDSPSLAQVEISNESSLAALWLYWDHQRWDQTIRGPYETELTRQWAAWLTTTYGSTERACQAWGGCTTAASQMVSPTDALALNGGAMATGWMGRARGKAEALVQRASDALGFSRKSDSTAVWTAPKVTDFVRFLADTDRHFFEAMRATIHAATRADLPVTGTQMGYGSAINFLSQSGMDYLDDHFYVDHYEFPAESWAYTNWTIQNLSLSGGELPRLLQLGWYRDRKRPFVVSEFSQAFPSARSSEIIPLMATVGAMQDWDGLYLYDYVGSDPGQNTPNNFNLQGDWSRAVVVGQSARIFRQGLVSTLPAASELPNTVQDISKAIALNHRPDTWPMYLSRKLGQDPLAALRTLVGVGQAPSPTTPHPSKVESDQLSYLPTEHRIVLSAPQVGGLFGEVASNVRTPAGGDLWLTATGAAPHTSVTLLALSADGKPIRESQRLLLSLPPFVTGSLPGGAMPRPQKIVPYPGQTDRYTLEPVPSIADSGPSGPRKALAPLWMSRLPLSIGLRRSNTPIHVYPLSPLGVRQQELSAREVRQTKEGYEIQVNRSASNTALWFEVVEDRRAP